jgi:putative sterol carrier protein
MSADVQPEAVTAEELHEALVEYVEKANASPRAQKTLATWTCRIHIEAADIEGAAFTFTVVAGVAQPIQKGLDGVPDLIVRGGSMDLAEIFWGDANPVSNYMQGAIRTQGRADDVMRLDAMAMFIFLGQ